jgi:mycothione reductase
VAPRVLRVNDVDLHADRFVLAAGSPPVIPSISGLDQVPYLTSDCVMRLDALPASMIIVGGGYIAAEMRHIFGSFGTEITIIELADTLLSQHDKDIRARFTEHYRERFDLRLNAKVVSISTTLKGVQVEFTVSDETHSVEAEVVLIATGREPTSDRLGVEAAGIDLDDQGRVWIDEYYRTSAQESGPSVTWPTILGSNTWPMQNASYDITC